MPLRLTCDWNKFLNQVSQTSDREGSFVCSYSIYQLLLVQASKTKIRISYLCFSAIFVCDSKYVLLLYCRKTSGDMEISEKMMLVSLATLANDGNNDANTSSH